MPLPQLIDALRAQAAERRAEELARADAEAERIRAESHASLAGRKAQHVERAIRDASEAARRSLSEARAEAAASTLRARDRLLGRVRAALEEHARASIVDPAHVATMETDLAAALQRLPSGEVVVRTRPELRRAFETAVDGRPGVTLETVPDMGVGFVAVSPETGVEIDATLQTQLGHRWPAIAVAVLTEVGR